MDTDQLMQLIARKRQVLELLVQLARRQREFIAAGDMTTLLKLLAAKPALIGQLQQTERQLDPYRADDPDRRAWRSPADRQACQQAAQRCAELLAELMQIERQDESEMVRRRDVAAEQLQGVHSAHAARSAYGAAPLPSPAFLDLSCES
jgi:flagellar biosynthesis/type III secretory pathway chaperone